jgi:hypothetical protein
MKDIKVVENYIAEKLFQKILNETEKILDPIDTPDIFNEDSRELTDLALNAIRDLFFSKLYDKVVPDRDVQVFLRSARWNKRFGGKNLSTAWKKLVDEGYVSKIGDDWKWGIEESAEIKESSEKCNWIIKVLKGNGSEVESYEIKDKTEEEAKNEAKMKIKDNKDLRATFQKSDVVSEEIEESLSFSERAMRFLGEDLEMKTFIVTFKHDNGKTKLRITARDERTAKEMVMNSESCPESAIIKVVEVNGTDKQINKKMKFNRKEFTEDTEEYGDLIGDEDEEQPSDEDAFLSSSGPLGSRTSVSCGGKFIGEFREYDDALIALGDYMEKSNWFPTVWTVSDHGNYNIVSDFLEELKRAREEKQLEADAQDPDEEEIA